MVGSPGFPLHPDSNGRVSLRRRGAAVSCPVFHGTLQLVRRLLGQDPLGPFREHLLFPSAGGPGLAVATALGQLARQSLLGAVLGRRRQRRGGLARGRRVGPLEVLDAREEGLVVLIMVPAVDGAVVGVETRRVERHVVHGAVLHGVGDGDSGDPGFAAGHV